MNRKWKKQIAAAVLVLILAGVLGAYYQSGQRSCTKPLFAMDTYMSFTAYGRNAEKAVDAAIEEVQRLDALLSTGSAQSELSRINEAGGGTMSEDTEILLKSALEIYKETGGLFDPTIYPLMQLWGFPTHEYHVPTEEELKETLRLVDASRVQYDGAEVTLGDGQKMDFGGIAKGYTSARIMEIFRSYGIRSGMVSLGGNVQVLGTKPDGSKWQIGIQNPDGGPGEVLAAAELSDRAAITSGGYERYFEEDGNTYIHIIDPRTGYPAEGDLASVTVISEDGMLADALSTSLYLMGYDGAMEYWRQHQTDFDLVLITDEGKICITEGIQDGFRSEWEYTVLGGAQQ